MKKWSLLVIIIVLFATPLAVQATQGENEKISSEMVTADEWFVISNSKSTSSERLIAFIEGYERFSEKRFIDGINHNARSLLNWATSVHQNNQFSTAKVRYDLILSASALDPNVRVETQGKHILANSNKNISANNWNELARQQSTSSERLAYYIAGMRMFPNDSRFEVGINNSARSLLQWASREHNNGNYTIALERYEFILSSPRLLDNVKLEVEGKRRLARDGKLITANHWHDLSMSRSSASERLSYFILGQEMYPKDSRFEVGINQSASSLLSWASREHENHRFNTAVDRYEFILTAPKLDTKIKAETEGKLALAKEKKLPVVNHWHDVSTNQSTASERLALFVIGHEMFPSDSRFQTGINSSAKSLLEWTTEQHQNRRYNTATERYKTILAVPALEDIIRTETEGKHALAKQNRRITGSSWDSIARVQTTASERLQYYVVGQGLYPSDIRQENGANGNAVALLNWATSEHQNGRFTTALDRYELILKVPRLQTSVKIETEGKHVLAREGKRPTAINWNTLSQSQGTASERLQYFIIGERLYPNDNTIEAGVNSNAKALLQWATNEHQNGRFSTAAERYETILSAQKLDENVKLETGGKNSLAKAGKYITADNWISVTGDSNTASDRLRMFIFGHKNFPNDVRFVQGINSNAIGLLSWATNEQQNNRFRVALDRYETILSAPMLDDFIKWETEIKMELAKKNLRSTSTHIFEVASRQSTSSQRLSYYLVGDKIYPKDNRFKEGITRSAQALLHWTEEEHRKGNFEVAIDRYEFIIQHIAIPSSIRTKASGNLRLAEQGIRTLGARRIVNGRVQNYTYEQMIHDIELLQAMYPDLMETKVIGKSLDGRNIYAIKLGYGETEILLDGSFHAREHMTTNVLMKMIDEYAYAYVMGTTYDGFNVRQVLDRTTIWFVPMVNPDGVTLVQRGPDALNNRSIAQEAIRINGGSRNFDSWKANARGVDLNRNFPALWQTITNDPGKPAVSHYKGPRPLSEPEAQVFFNFVRSRDFKTNVSYHSSGNVIFARQTGHVANIVSKKTGYDIIDTSRGTSGGTSIIWFVAEYGRPGLTMEISPFVGNRPVPLANWDAIWRENNSVGLLLADEAYRNRNRR